MVNQYLPGELLPLTHGQEALWYLDRMDSVGGVYSIAVAVRAGAGLDPEALIRAVRDLAGRHPALRAAVVETPAGPRQRIAREPRLDCAVLDLWHLAPAAIPARIARDARRRFDLVRGPLIRLVLYRRRGGWDFLLALHHLIADLGSFEVIARELAALLARRAYPAGAGLPEPAPYGAWVAAERRRLGGGDGERLAAWWAEALPEEPPPLALPADRPRPAFQSFLGRTVTSRLGKEATVALGRFARRRRASLSTLLLAAFQALLHRLSGQDELAVGVPTAGRGSRETAGLVGYLVNPVVVASDVSGGPTFADHLESARERLVAAVEHRDFPFPLLARRLRPERDPSRSPIFQAMFVHQRVRGGGLGAFALALPGARLDLGGAVVSPLRLPGERAQVDVQLSSAEVRGGPDTGLALDLQVAAALFDRATAQRWLGALEVLLEAAVEAPEAPVAELPLLTRGERAAVVTEWPWGGPAPAAAPALHQAFAARAAQVPDRLAVVGAGEAVSYAELARRMRRGAARLSAGGAGPEARVAVCLERSPALIASLLSVLEAGAAYVPIDPGLPETRRRLVLRDSGAALLVARGEPSWSEDDPRPRPVRRLGPEELAAAPEDGAPLGAPLGRAADPESLAYLIYTSGSTGTPKAVGIRHRSAAALVAWAGEAFRPPELDRVLAATSVGFDLSVFEIFIPLAAGGTVVLAGSILDFAHLPERDRVTLVNTVPSALEELIRLRPLPPSVAAVNLAGEPLPEPLAAAVHRQRPGVRLSNLYAPSESTTYSTCSRIGPGGGAPAIGRPFRGERAHAVDGRLGPVPVGVAGEVVLGGAGIARGYLGRPALTAGRFVPDPFAPESEPGARLYRTGDVAWWRPGGELAFGGRRDHQVKVRGYRIELGEVEAALGTHPGVAQAVVVVAADGAALSAFVLPADDLPSEPDRSPAALVPETLVSYLAERLPAPMVPSSFTVVPAFPRTAGGKIDRRALLAQAADRSAGPPGTGAPEAPSTPPRTPVEEALAELFREVLELPAEAPLGVHDDLFRLGGHSLLAARLAARVRDVLGAEVPLPAFLARPTVAGLAAAVAGRSGTATAIPAAADPLAPPLSFAQERLWFLDRLDPGSARYNMPAALRLRGRLDLPALASALAGLAARHQPLRARIGTAAGAGEEAGAPVQSIAPPGPVPVPFADLSGLCAAAAGWESARLARAEARRPLALGEGPPARHLLVRARPDDHLLVLVVHHAAADGWSLRVVVPRDLEALYAAARPGRERGRGPALPPLPIRYGDFALWQRRQLAGGRLAALLEHWRVRLDGLPRLDLPRDLPRDRPRPQRPAHAGGALRVGVPAPLAERLRALGRERGATLFMVVLAAYQVLLARLAGANDLAVGVPHAQRDRSEVEGLVGLFVNTLVLRAAVRDGEPFASHLERVRRRAVGAFAHADLPFERLVEELRGGEGGGDPRRPPLIQAFLAFDATPAALPRLRGLEVERVDLDSGTAKFDVSLLLEEAPGAEGSALRGVLEYDAELFDAASAGRWVRRLGRLLEAVADDPAAPVAALAARAGLTPAEHAQVATGAVEPVAPAVPVDSADPMGAPRRRGTGPGDAGIDPQDPIAELIRRVWADVLGLDRPAAAGDDFFALGGHSLLGARVVARLSAAVEVDLPVRTLFDHPRLDRFAAAVRSARGAPSLPPVEPAFPADPAAPFAAPASHAQQRLWFLDRLVPGSPAYNVPVAARLAGEASAAELARALARVARRHAVLRTRLVESDGPGGEPVQVVEPPSGQAGQAGPASLVPSVAELSALPEARAAAESRRLARWEARLPFDLARAPLARALLVRRAAGDHDLLLTLHHAVADGWSLGVLLGELGAFYGPGRRPLPPLPVQYADFAAWQRRWLAGSETVRQLDFWRRELAGLQPLDLPGRGAGRPRPPVASYRGGQLPVALPAPVAEACRRAARALGATPFMVLLAAFQAVLGRISGQREFGVATAVANRRRPELEGLIGLFVNTLVLRADLGAGAEGGGPEPDLRALVARTRRRALAAYDHQDLPFERLVEALEPDRDLARPPLAQVMLVVHNEPRPAPRLAGLTVTPFDRDSGTAKLDLTLAFRDRPEGISGYLEYAADRFDPTGARRLAATFLVVLDAALGDPGRPIIELPLLAPAERHQLLAEWSGAGLPRRRRGPASGTLDARVRAAAVARPEAIAIAAPGTRLSYGELVRRSAVLARRLRHRDGGGIGPEATVGVCLERTPSLIVALLGVLEAGAAYVPLDPAYPAHRLGFMIEDSGCAVVIAEPATAARLSEAVPGGTRVLHLADLEREVPRGATQFVDIVAAHPAPAPSERLAYVIYTSGSTGRPKGVAIEHRSAAAFLDWVEEAFAPAQMRGVLAATSVCFDLSLFELFGTLARGGTVVLAGGVLDLPELPTAREATLVNTVPSILSELLRWGALPEGVTTVALAGEPLAGELVRRIEGTGRSIRPLRVLNLYGPSESTTYATCGAAGSAGREEPAGEPTIGRPVAGTRAYLVDRALRPLPAFAAGEIVLAGGGLARGYLGRPARTAESFVPDPFGDAPGGRLYRTGDRAVLTPAGELAYLGRGDDQVKVRGFRIELGEVEAALRAAPGVAEAMAVAVGEPGGADRRLAAFVVADPGAGGEALRRWPVADWAGDPAGELAARLAGELPAHAVPSSITLVEALPRTTSGKVDRRALRDRAGRARPPEEGPGGRPGAPDHRAARGGAPAPRGPIEEMVAEAWREVLGIERVGVHDDFFGAGGHSLLAARLAARLREVSGAELSVAGLFRETTVAGQAAWIGRLLLGSAGSAGADAAPVPLPEEERRRGVPLAPGQARLLFLHRLQAPAPVYHLPLGLRIAGPLDPPALAGALGDVVRRHEAFRIRIVSGGGHRTELLPPEGGELQAAAPPWRPALPVADLSGLPPGPAAAAARRATGAWVRRPFDLASGRLLAPLLVRLPASPEGPEHVLVLSQHHLVTDGWSQGVLVRDLARLYEARLERAGGRRAAGAGASLPVPVFQPGDVAAWQRQRLASGDFAPVLEHWRERLAGLGPLELPADRPRPAVPTHRGAGVPFALPSGLVDRLHGLGRERAATPFTVLLAGFQALLARYAGASEVAVGVPVAHRDRPGLEHAVAFLVDTVVLRTDLGGDPTFAEALARVRVTVLDAFAHQDAPFERVVEIVRPERDLGRTPLFEAFFAFQDLPAPEPRLGTARLTLEPVTTGATQFPLTVTARPEAGTVAGSVEVDLDLFDEVTARRLARHLESLLAAAAAAPDRPLASLGLLGRAERHQLTVEHGRPRTAFPAAEPLYRRFRRRAAERPDAVAVVEAGRAVSYGELERRAEHLGAYLRSRGAGADDVVAILAGRSLDGVIAALGVHAAGAAYLSLDPGHPAERIAYSLADARARLVLTGGDAPVRLTDHRAARGGAPAPPALPVAEAIARGAAPGQSPTPDADLPATCDERLAYVIYTSGSTGRPKGVMVDQRGLARLYDSVRDRLRYLPSDTISQFHSPAFDFSVWELWSALAHGARLLVVPPEAALAADELLRVVERERVTVLGQTPSAFRALQELDQASPEPRMRDLRVIDLGGEALVPASIAPWLARHGDERPRLVNLYGPTETVVIATYRRILRDDLRRGAVSPIGDAIADAALYLLDRSARPVPLGVPGEIRVGGAGLARGYLRRPALTAERFLPDPFAAVPGARAYRTGDRARRRPDGELEFLGRLDAQVKIRGHRVEPGEVEAVLVEHPAVAAGAVVARHAAAGGQRLVAYVVPRDGGSAPLGDAELRSALGDRLPPYMLPERFVFLDAMPRTSSDKIDRTALPEPSSERPDLIEFQPPRSALEDAIAAVWCEVLELDRVGIYDNFFDLGGHSLLLGRAHRRLAERLGRELPLVELFRHTTIAALAAHLDREGAAPAARREARQAEREARSDRAMDRRERTKRRRQALAGALGGAGRRPGAGRPHLPEREP